MTKLMKTVGSENICIMVITAPPSYLHVLTLVNIDLKGPNMKKEIWWGVVVPPYFDIII